MTPPSPPRWAVWATLVAAGVAYEIHELLDPDEGVPLSRVIRAAFRTDTPTGSAVFVLCVNEGSRWLVRHITEGQSMRVKI